MFSNCGAESEDSLPCGALILNTVFDLNLTNVIVETALAMDYLDLACLTIHLSQIQFSDKTEQLRTALEETLRFVMAVV